MCIVLKLEFLLAENRDVAVDQNRVMIGDEELIAMDIVGDGRRAVVGGVHQLIDEWG